MLSSWLLRAHTKMARWPDTALTFALLAIAVVIVIIALAGSRWVKGGTLAWTLLP